jgi:hypothetical protein
MPVIDRALLAESLGKLDAGTRALLDLSLRRAIPDDQVAQVLGVDPASIPPRRARGIAQLADMMEVPGPSELAALLLAIPDLPEEAWGVPTPVPFSGGVSLAGRAKAFRRVAIAASPLVALGAVMAAVLVSSSDHSGSSPASSLARGTGAAAGASAVTAPAPEARHGLPKGVQLSSARRPARAAHHAARRHHARRHAGAADEHAVLARKPTTTVEHSTPVVYHPPAVVHEQPRHVDHHHNTPSKPKTPTHTPAPIQNPSQPVTTPAPTQPTTPAVQVSPPQQTTTVHSGPSPEPGKPYKTPPPPVVVNGPGDEESGDDGGGGCGDRYGGESDQGSSHHDWEGESHGNGNAYGHSGGGRSFTPPGLFRKHHGSH